MFLHWNRWFHNCKTILFSAFHVYPHTMHSLLWSAEHSPDPKHLQFGESCKPVLHLYSFSLQYPVLSSDIILCVLMLCIGTVCTFTVGQRSNNCLPVAPASHLFCHFILQDSWTAVFISSAVTGLVTSGILSASSAAVFANWSAISLPAMSACPGVHFKLIWICSFSNDFNAWLISAITCLCELFCHPRVKIPTADCESENNVTSLNLLFLASTLTWSNAILIATSSPNKIEALLATGWCKSILSWLGKNRHAPAPQGPGLPRQEPSVNPLTLSVPASLTTFSITFLASSSQRAQLPEWYFGQMAANNNNNVPIVHPDPNTGKKKNIYKRNNNI